MLVYSHDTGGITRGRKVVIADDHPQMRGGLRNVLAGMLGCEVVGETALGEEVLGLIEDHQPDLLVLDLSLAGRMTGHDVLHEIRRKQLPVKVFVHTAFLSKEDFDEWVNGTGGPDGIDEKGTGDRELVIGFTQVLGTDDKYVPVRLMKKFGAESPVKAFDRLTPTEKRILKLALRSELSTHEIASQLGYSSSTVRYYLTTIYAKLGLEQHTRTALLAFYYQHRDEVTP